MKISLATDLEIQAFSGSTITDYNSGSTNVIVNKIGQRFQVTQRPSIDISEDSSDAALSHLNNRGRGLYYWENNTKLYIVHDNDVYSQNQQTASAAGTITAGSEPVTMLESLGTPYLIILDAENNEGWVMNAGETVAAIASNFPSSLAHGGLILDTYLFVMDEDGNIYNSAVNDPTTFPATGVLRAERENDKGVYLGKHHDTAVAFLTRSIEIFYDAGNSVGSPLNRRQDVSYNVGCVGGLGVWENGDITYFLGSSPSGQIAVYELKNYGIRIISNDSINAYLTQIIIQDGISVRLSGLSAMGHDTLIMTIFTLTGSPTAITPQSSIKYDALTAQWGFWDTSLNTLGSFPLMAWTRRTGGQNATVSARTGQGIFSNGDIVSINDKLIPIDTILGAQGVFESGVFETDVFAGTSSSNGLNIPITIRTGLIDGETSAYKFQNKETVEMENTPNTQTLTIKHSDESSNNFDTGNTVDTTDDRKDVHGGGRFMKRNFQLEYGGDEQIYLESLDVELEAGL